MNKRMAVRYDCYNLWGELEGERVKVVNISLDGIALETSNNIAVTPNSVKKLTLEEKSPDGKKTFDVRLAGKSEESKRYHFKFLRPQRLERLGDLNRHFSKPSECPYSNRQRYDCQKVLVENDIDDLQGNIQGLKNCQFQLVLAAIPILFGIVASSVVFVTNQSVSNVGDFYFVLPPATIVMCCVMLAIFIQKTESIRRASAFTLILQRHLAMGSIPACYRGWHDAFENYNHFVRHGPEKSSPFNFPPIQERNIKQKVPADSFTWLSVGLFTVVAVLSLILMIYALWLKMSDSSLTQLSFYLVASGSVSVFIVVSFWFYKKYKALTVGDRSFRYLVVLFSKLLKYAPPFDPYRN